VGVCPQELVRELAAAQHQVRKSIERAKKIQHTLTRKEQLSAEVCMCVHQSTIEGITMA
jgi:hypothetical protein